MLPRLLRCFAVLLLLLSPFLPFAAGQNDMSVERGVKLDSTADGEKSSSSGPALPYFVMAVYTMLVLTIVCMPSRKA